MRTRFEVADIFRQYGEAYKKKYGMTDNQRKVMAAIMACRTAQLGGHSEVCDNCGTIRNSYNSCRNRHCPKCQTMAKEKWLEQRKTDLLPCGYFHMVFTVPHSFNPLILRNRRELLTSMFHAVRNTIKGFAADPQWKLEGTPGLLTILHTWSQTLIDHFHIHCLIPAGVLSFDKLQWKASNEKYLFRVESLAKEFKKQFLSMIVEKYKSLRHPPDSEALLTESKSKTWLVYARKPFAGPEQVLEYLGRYTHRIAISNHRIKEIKNGDVTFSYRDRSQDNQIKRMTVSGVEFIRRFVLHVLPFRFVKIRYYGFLANICRKKSVLLIRRLIGKDMSVDIPGDETSRERLIRLTGRDIYLCPQCKCGTMVFNNLLLPQYDSG